MHVRKFNKHYFWHTFYSFIITNSQQTYQFIFQHQNMKTFRFQDTKKILAHFSEINILLKGLVDLADLLLSGKQGSYLQGLSLLSDIAL